MAMNVQESMKPWAQEWVVFYIVELITAMALGGYLIGETMGHANHTAIGLVVTVGLAAHQLLQVGRLYLAKTMADGRLERAAMLAEAHSVTWIAIMLLYVTVWSMT